MVITHMTVNLDAVKDNFFLDMTNALCLRPQLHRPGDQKATLLGS